MTVREYNKEFYPKYQKALSFISCLRHTIPKCEGDTDRQLKIIGWDSETEELIKEALVKLLEAKRNSVYFYDTDEEKAEKIENIKLHCIELCSGGVQCLTCNQYKNKEDRMEFVECLD